MNLVGNNRVNFGSIKEILEDIKDIVSMHPTLEYVMNFTKFTLK